MKKKIFLLAAVAIVTAIVGGSQCALFPLVPIGGEGEGEGGPLQLMGGVELLSLRQFKTDLGLQVFGRLFNTNALEVSLVQLSVRFLDKDGNLRDERLVSVQKIPPARISGFTVLSLDPTVEKAEAEILLVLF